MTFENNDINYPLEIKTIRSYFNKETSLEKYCKLIDCATMLYLNADSEWKSQTHALLQETIRRKEIIFVKELNKQGKLKGELKNGFIK
jgi:hypothetical protein